MIYNKILFGPLFFIILITSASTSDLSLYNIPTKWSDEKNNLFSFSDMHGKKVVIAMAYTSCQGTCPMMVSKLKKIENLFTAKNIPIEMAIITFDPKIDTPERNFSFYREQMGLKNKNWHFLRGSDNDTRKISMLLGIKYAVNPKSKAISHENKIILLNESGEVEKKLENLAEDETSLLN
jgi:protein SCO1/2